MTVNLQPNLFYYFYNESGDDTAQINSYIWNSRGAPHFSFVVVTEEVKQNEGLHFALMGNIAYRYKFGSEMRWSLNGNAGYQHGFGYFIKFRQRLVNINNTNDYTIVEHSLNGRSLQFSVSLGYHFGQMKTK